MIDDRYPTEVLDEDDDDGTMPANVAELEKVVIGRRIVSAEKRPDLDTSYTASTLRWRPMPEPLLRASTSSRPRARAGAMEAIRDYYGVPAKRGARVRFTYNGISRDGVIISARRDGGMGLYLRFDGQAPDDRSGPFHPTWGLEYLDV
jgi:hypothetical protein